MKMAQRILIILAVIIVLFAILLLFVGK